MKLENTLKNKQKFFAQYWGQFIGFYISGKETIQYSLNGGNIDEVLDNNKEWIELKPLSKINDIDVIDVLKTIDPEKTHGDWRVTPYVINFIEKDLIKSEDIDISNDKVIEANELLKFKGYAVPWLGLSVDDMINDKCNTRQEAREKAIEKAVEIFNERV